MKIRIKIKNKTQNESKKSECEKNNGWACYMLRDDPKPAKNKTIEPVKLKKEDKMINKPSSDIILQKNEAEIEKILNSDETSDSLRAVILDELNDLESEPEAYKALFSRHGAVGRFMERCLDKLR